MNEGKTIGHYKILRPLGKGGMGEVYLAQDTKLQRQVALKFLSESVRNDPDRLARFRREALAAASLKHPNIATIHALEDIDDHTFIVMEYVEGEPLSAHIPSDGMNLDTFFATFIPLADALAHAHGQGRVHRDLKPGNIMIANDGAPKILDFGLARIITPDPVQTAYEQSETTPEIDSDAPTRTMKPQEHEVAGQGVPSLTYGGQLMGTPQYMSPEQAEREEADHRTDLFSFGVVMYEALTSHRPFEGKTLESIIGRILAEEPRSITALKPNTPYPLWQVIRKCLRKRRENRTQTASELYTDLCEVQQEVQAGTALVEASTMPTAAHVPFWRQPLALGLAAAMLIIGLTAAWFLKPVPEPPLRRFALTAASFANTPYNGPAVSPDGRMIAYSQNGKLWIRDLDTVTPRELPDTQGASRPFWSPGSDFVAYFTGGELHKVAATGGPSVPLCDLPGGFSRGGVWRPDGTIVFSVVGGGDINRSGILYSVSAQGGEPAVFAAADSSLDQRGLIYPALLPDGSLVYAATVGEEAGALVVQSRQDRRVILSNRGERVAFPVYSPSGHIVYQRGFPESKGLWAVGFDAGSRQVSGEPFPVDTQGGYPTVSSDGTLVYRSVAAAAAVPSDRLAWVDRQGRVEPLGQTREGLSDPAPSLDGRLAAFSAVNQGNTDIWVYDLSRDTATRLTYDPAGDIIPVFSPDGRWVAFSSFRSGGGDIYVKAADGSGGDALLVGGLGIDWPTSWSRDGRRLIYYNIADSTGGDLWYAALRVDGAVTLDGSPQPFLRTPFNERFGRLSPDGRYLAYASNESGRFEVYVMPFPGGGSKWQVSPDGGMGPRWSAKGDELFYVADQTAAGNGPMMAVRLETAGGFRAGKPRKLFDAPAGVRLFTFNVSSDGQRFLAVQQGGEGGTAPQTTITVVENWAQEFEDRE